MKNYWVVYDSPNGTKTYNSVPMYCLNEAIDLLRKFRQQYVGKQYPNKKGFYPFRNARIEIVE